MVVRGLKKVKYPACKMTYGIDDSLGFSSKLSEVSDLSDFTSKSQGVRKSSTTFTRVFLLQKSDFS